MKQLREQARPIFERFNPGHANALPLILQPVINIEAATVPDAALPTGTSKLGGQPDLGEHTWPTAAGEPMFFVAQFHCSEFKPFDEDDLLPSSGLLSFFLGRRAIENGETAPEHWAVLYTRDASTLRRAAPPADMDRETHYTTPAHTVTFHAGVHPWGDVLIWEGDELPRSLHYDQLVHNPEWNAVVGPGNLTGECYLLGHANASMINEVDVREEETALLTLPATSDVFPFVDLGNSLSFAFLIPRSDLRHADFRQVRLVYSLS